MRYLILSDMHANLAALEAVMAEVHDEYDRVLCLGDVVGYGPDPNEVSDLTRSLQPVATVRGNHDKACCGITNAEDFNIIARVAALWTRKSLTPDNLTFLRELPEGPLAVDDFQIVHGSPRDEDEYLFTAGEAQENLLEVEVALTFFGHTHIQGGFWWNSDGQVTELKGAQLSGVAMSEWKLESGAKYLINPGSIGQPRDGDPRAAFAVFDAEERVVEFWRVPYPVETTQQRVLEAGLPAPLGARLSLGR